MNKTIRELLSNTEFSDLIEKFEGSGVTKFFHLKKHLFDRTLLEFLKDIEDDKDKRMRLSKFLYDEFSKHNSDPTKIFGVMLVVGLVCLFFLMRSCV